MRWKALDRAMNLSLVPAQGDAFFQVFFCDAVLGFGALGPTFSSTSFPSIDAVGSKILTALHEYVDCDTHQRAPNKSSIKLLNVRVLDLRLLLGLELSTFPSSYLLLVASVGPEASVALHEYINGAKSVFDNSSGRPR